MSSVCHLCWEWVRCLGMDHLCQELDGLLGMDYLSWEWIVCLGMIIIILKNFNRRSCFVLGMDPWMFCVEDDVVCVRNRRSVSGMDDVFERALCLFAD